MSRLLEDLIIRRLLNDCREAGFRLIGVNDGEEFVSCDTDEAALKAIYSVDDSTVVFHKLGGWRYGVRLILGNGEDVLSDWTDKPEFDAVLCGVLDWIDKGVAA